MFKFTRIGRAIGGIFLGLVIIVVGFVIGGLMKKAEKTCTEPGTGIIYEVREEWETGESSHYTYIPLFEYEVDGKKYDAEGASSTNRTEYSVGDTIAFKYNPEDPREILVGDDNASGIFTWALVGLGGVTSVLSVASIFNPRIHIR